MCVFDVLCLASVQRPQLSFVEALEDGTQYGPRAQAGLSSHKVAAVKIHPPPHGKRILSWSRSRRRLFTFQISSNSGPGCLGRMGGLSATGCVYFKVTGLHCRAPKIVQQQMDSGRLSASWDSTVKATHCWSRQKSYFTKSAMQRIRGQYQGIDIHTSKKIYLCVLSIV